ncbi:MAG: hypothetical protein E7514_06100 [Ruminococcaceae bacterium]|nr:hypothetical protein [Oscillospiraceae bacterium]
MEDSDIKIFQGKSAKKNTDDSIALIEEMNAQRVNGNTQRAYDLGNYLADRFLNTEELRASLEEEVGPLNYSEKVIFQIKILVFFTAEYCINRLLPNTLTKSTAINTIYDKIVKNAGDFYEEFNDGVEYSFYYLAVKKDDVLTEVGNTFAMLCRKTSDENFAILGKDIFVAVVNEVDKIIRSYEFVR